MKKYFILSKRNNILMIQPIKKERLNIEKKLLKKFYDRDCILDIICIKSKIKYDVNAEWLKLEEASLEEYYIKRKEKE